MQAERKVGAESKHRNRPIEVQNTGCSPCAHSIFDSMLAIITSHSIRLETILHRLIWYILSGLSCHCTGESEAVGGDEEGL